MKIILVGNHNPHFFNTVECREKALRELGHKVIFFDARASFFPGRLRRALSFLQRWDARRNGERLIHLAKKECPDLCLVVGTSAASETLKALGKARIRTALWTTDAPMDVPALTGPAPFFDYIFCSGTEAVDLLKAAGPLKGEPRWLPFACDPGIHRRVELSTEDRVRYGRAIAFVGSYYPNRREHFESLADLDIGIWGPHWDRLGPRSPLKGKADPRRINFDEWSRIYSASDIVLVVHYNDGRTPCHQASPKLFEAMACGAFVLCDDQKDARAIFKDGEHLVFFKNKEDLRAKIVHYLARPDERQRIAEAGRLQVVTRHTYQRRVEELLALMNGSH